MHDININEKYRFIKDSKLKYNIHFLTYNLTLNRPKKNLIAYHQEYIEEYFDLFKNKIIQSRICIVMYSKILYKSLIQCKASTIDFICK